MSEAKILWFTGMSGAGKTTIAAGLEGFLKGKGKKVLVLDGDKIRSATNKHLGFSCEDIRANNISIIEMCRENIDSWDYILVTVISPFEESRERARRELGGRYHEIYVKAPLDILIHRDTKGFYRKALDGKMQNFIGIDKAVPYEPPKDPDVLIDTEKQDPQGSIDQLINFITHNEQDQESELLK